MVNCMALVFRSLELTTYLSLLRFLSAWSHQMMQRVCPTCNCLVSTQGHPIRSYHLKGIGGANTLGVKLTRLRWRKTALVKNLLGITVTLRMATQHPVSILSTRLELDVALSIVYYTFSLFHSAKPGSVRFPSQCNADIGWCVRVSSYSHRGSESCWCSSSCETNQSIADLF